MATSRTRRAVRPGPVSETVALERDRVIVRNATREFLTKGFHGASLAAISKKSRISKNTLYGIYGSKKGLFNHIATASIASYRYDIEQALDTAQPFTRVIRHVVELFVEATALKFANAVLRLAISERDQFPSIGKLMLENSFAHVDPLANYLRKMSRQPIPKSSARLQAYHLLGMSCGGYGSVLVSADTLFGDRKVWVDTVVDLFVRGFPYKRTVGRAARSRDFPHAR